MSGKRETTVRQMHAGQSGTVVEILGGHGLVNRLNSLGIRPGKRITKVSSMFLRGPVTIEVGQSLVAIGFGMAGKILVDIEEEKR